MKYLLIILVLLAGCCSSRSCFRTPRPGVVRIENNIKGKSTIGNAAIVTDNLAITAQHVAYELGESNIVVVLNRIIKKVRWHNGVVVANIDHFDNIEPISIISIPSSGFRDHKGFRLGFGEPAVVVTHRGEFSWDCYKPLPGDSGSPVLNSKGHIIGLLYGHDMWGSPVYLEITPELYRAIEYYD